MISHLFCHIIFNGSESLGPAHIQGEGIIESSEYQEGEVIVDILEAAYLPKDTKKVCTPFNSHLDYTTQSIFPIAA